jgi:hypothetical protein
VGIDSESDGTGRLIVFNESGQGICRNAIHAQSARPGRDYHQESAKGLSSMASEVNAEEKQHAESKFNDEYSYQPNCNCDFCEVFREGRRTLLLEAKKKSFELRTALGFMDVVLISDIEELTK